VTYKEEKYTFRILEESARWKHERFTKNHRAIDLMSASNRKSNTTSYFFTSVDNDAPRYVQFDPLTPGGDFWNTEQRLLVTAWLSGRRIEHGQVLKLQKGRYPLMLRVAMGECEEGGKIWMGPRLRDVTQCVIQQTAEYERDRAAWPEYERRLGELFVLGENTTK